MSPAARGLSFALAGVVGLATAAFSSQLRLPALLVHLRFSVGWIGAVVAYLALVVAAMTSENAQPLRAEATLEVLDQLPTLGHGCRLPPGHRTLLRHPDCHPSPRTVSGAT
jgi:hypothetical protein